MYSFFKNEKGKEREALFYYITSPGMRSRAANPDEPANMKLSLMRLPFSSQNATVLLLVAVFEARSLARRPPFYDFDDGWWWRR
jgi:hypothetical protein